MFKYLSDPTSGLVKVSNFISYHAGPETGPRQGWVGPIQALDQEDKEEGKEMRRQESSYLPSEEYELKSVGDRALYTRQCALEWRQRCRRGQSDRCPVLSRRCNTADGKHLLRQLLRT